MIVPIFSIKKSDLIINNENFHISEIDVDTIGGTTGEPNLKLSGQALLKKLNHT